MGTETTGGPGRRGETPRRDFLRRSALAGGVIWAAPAVTRVSRAYAQTGSLPPGCGGPEACVGTAYGAFIDLIGPMRFPAAPGSPCPVGACEPIDIGGLPAPFEFRAGSACGCTGASADEACLAEGSVAEVFLRVDKSMLGPMATSDLQVGASVLKSITTQACDTCADAGRASHIVGLAIGLPNGDTAAVDASAAPNTVVTDSQTLFPGLRIVVNEQGCAQNGNWYTAALTITLPTATPLPGRRIILGYSETRALRCQNPCQTPPETAEIVPLP